MIKNSGCGSCHINLTLKDHFKEQSLFVSRVLSAGVIIVVLLMILLSRLVYLQIYQHDLYSTLSRNNRVNVIPTAPTRGLIFDRQGTLLADNISSFTLSLTPQRVTHLSDTIKELQSLIHISKEDIAHFYKVKRYKRRHDAVPIRYKLTEQEVAAFYTERHRFPGVDVTAGLTRYYPHGFEYAHVLGYIGPINEQESLLLDSSKYQATYYFGKTGIEKEYEDILHGSPGYRQVETDARGRVIRTLEANSAQPGKNLHLTLDHKMQQTAYKAFAGRKGALVALDPRTGDVLAMISQPSFQPNLFVQGIDYKRYNKLNTSSEQPLFNRATMGQYPPASTIKPLIALQALAHDVITPSRRIYCPGWYRLNEDMRVHRDWNRRGHSWTNLNKAIAESCDVYFYSIANELGIDKLEQIFTAFGLGQVIGSDLGPQRSGLVPSRAWKEKTKGLPWYPGETINVGIGQGYMLATPMHIAQAAAIIANRGLKPTPHLLRQENQEDRIQIPLKEIPLSFSNEQWQLIVTAMTKTVTSIRGSAHRIAKGLKYTLAGKTGTAQVFSLDQDEEYDPEKLDSKLHDHSWFMAFAPVEQPEVAIAVIIENSGGASIIARQVLDSYFQETQTDAHKA